jgi:hypothetical protein
MKGWLKQSTAVTVKVGPFLDETDGKTAETALTIAQADVRLSKNGGDMAQKNESTTLTHDEIGIYDCLLNTTDTNTAGILTLAVHESGALPVRQDYLVVPAHVYDSWTVSTGAAHSLGIVDQGTAQAATSSTIQLRSAAAFADDELVGMIVVTTGGTGVGQARVITDYVSSTDTATVSPNWQTTPSGTIEYKIFAAAPAPTASGSLPPVNVEAFGGVAGTFASGIPEVKTASIATGAVSTMLTTQMTEAYAADGAAPTLAQALMMIQQMLGDFAISGTTLTVKKVDGSTTAATYTLNDSASPTSITRST